MTELLSGKGYRVVGASRDPANARRHLVGARYDAIEIVGADLLSTSAITALIRQVKPDEVYNFAAFSTGSGMYDQPVAMGDLNGLAVARILDAIRAGGNKARFCQASSSEMFGAARVSPQNEITPFNPRSPYGAAKLFAHNLIGIARERDAAFACSAILFNHESPRRGTAFVTRKVTRAAAAIRLGLAREVVLGDLDARRDWGHARDVANAMWLMLQADQPNDYVVATGQTHAVSDLCRISFDHVGLDWTRYVRVDAALTRAPDRVQLVGDPMRAKARLGWAPSTSFKEMIVEMVDADLQELQSTSGSKGNVA